jgi:hypothetical protein
MLKATTAEEHLSSLPIADLSEIFDPSWQKDLRSTLRS